MVVFGLLMKTQLIDREMEKQAFNMTFVTNIQIVDEYTASEDDKDLPFGCSSSKALIAFNYLHDTIATIEFETQAEAEIAFKSYVAKYNLESY